MRTKQVFHKRSRKEVESVSTSFALEAQEMARSAAKPVPAGETIKGQLRRSARALGYADGDWRVKAAWYGRAESWSAKALEDLRARYRAFDEKQGRLADAADQKQAALLRAEAETEKGGRHEERRRALSERRRAYHDEMVANRARRDGGAI